MAVIVEFIRSVDWSSPQAVVLVILLTVLAVMRKWFLLAMATLVITLGRGICYLQLNKEVLSNSTLTLASCVYLVGGVILVSIAAIEFFVRHE